MRPSTALFAFAVIPLVGAVGCSAADDAAVTADDAAINSKARSQAIRYVPWTVALLGDDQKPFCSGVIVDEAWILTSHSCVGSHAPGFQIAAGFEDLRKLSKWNALFDEMLGGGEKKGAYYDGALDVGQISTVDKIAFAKGYGALKPGNDIALLHLATAFDLNGLAPVRSAMLANEDDVGAPGVKGRIAGWGGRDAKTWWKVSGAKVTFAAPKTKVAKSQTYGTVTGDLFPGDLGGPVTLANDDLLGEDPGLLLGITSSEADGGAIFESVAPHLEWINDKIRGF